MSAPSAPTLSDVVNAIFNAILSIVKGIADAISANATVIGTAVIVVGLGYAVFRFGRRIVDLFRGFLPF
jgi:hypothetical protein